MRLQSPDDLQPALQGQVQADVVIVGGGYTGLSAALALRESGVDVVLLEMDYCGKGASGRNAGHLTPTIGQEDMIEDTAITMARERGLLKANVA